MKNTLFVFLLLCPTLSTAFCPLQCTNSGTCQVNANTSAPRCACPPGFTGTLCESIYVSCHDTTMPCQNGGTCLLGEEDDFGNVQRFCQCANVNDSNGTPMFHGKYCQHNVLSVEAGLPGPGEDATDLLACSEETQALFCLHDGKCNSNYPDFGDPCLCKTGYSGPRCEIAEIGNVATNTVDAPPPPPAPTTSFSTNQGVPATNSWPTTTCTKKCFNNGLCKTTPVADADLWSSIPGTTAATQFCECPEGWGGPDCQVAKSACGTEHSCYYGSTCSHHGEYSYCDCATASQPVAGTYCHLPSSAPCGASAFCVNGGTCISEQQGCACSAEFTGFACEFRAGTDIVSETTAALQSSTTSQVAVTSCDLPCQNGGTCRHDGGYHADNAVQSFLSDQAFSAHHVLGQHCVCPPNQAGAYCEHFVVEEDVETCGHGRHQCPGDNTRCVAYGEEILCECGSMSLELASFFEASYCEHPVHDVCTIGAVMQKSVLPGGALSYCTNGGRCVKAVTRQEGHAGCNCPEGWVGPHCEIPEGVPIARVANNANIKSMPTARQTGRRVSLSIFGLLAVGAALLVARSRRHRRHHNHVNQSLFWAGGYRDSTEDQDTVNIAPKRQSVFATDTVYDSAIRSSNGQVMVQQQQHSQSQPSRGRRPSPHAEEVEGVELTDTSTTEEEDMVPPPEEPKLYMGPPRDEDGHELHNVEIV